MSERIDLPRRGFWGLRPRRWPQRSSACRRRPGANGCGEGGIPAGADGRKPYRLCTDQARHAGGLSVGYAEAGPANGPVALLLHGWPYDIHSFVDVAPLLAARGYRVIIPYLRGHGSTTFLSSDAFRNGQPSAIAADMIALMDALRIRNAVVAGFDWGARTADIMAALWPDAAAGWYRSAAT